MGCRLRNYLNLYQFYKEIMNDLVDIYENFDR